MSLNAKSDQVNLYLVAFSSPGRLALKRFFPLGKAILLARNIYFGKKPLEYAIVLPEVRVS
jgi:hypothetical protein